MFNGTEFYKGSQLQLTSPVHSLRFIIAAWFCVGLRLTLNISCPILTIVVGDVHEYKLTWLKPFCIYIILLSTRSAEQCPP